MKKKRNPGRPVTNHRVRELMKEHGCSRTWAYVLWRRELRLSKAFSTPGAKRAVAALTAEARRHL